MATQHIPEPTNTPTANQNDTVAVDTDLKWNELIEEHGRNKEKIICSKCSSLVLDKLVGQHVELEKMLPEPTAKSTNSSQSSKFLHFWMVDDIFKFENCGFSNTVDAVKYLTCADCEIGPIGYQDLNSKLCFVALARVKHA